MCTIKNDKDNLTIVEYSGKNIFIIENVFDIDFCDELVKTIDKLPLNYDYIKPKNNVECYYANMSKLLNTSEDYYYKFNINKSIENDYLNNKLNGVSKQLLMNYNNIINNKLQCIINSFTKMNMNINAYAHCGVTFRKIYGKTQLHADGIRGSEVVDINNNQIQTLRSLSVVISLNDNYDGGLFNFPNQNVSIKLKKNSAILFPPFWTHPHEVSDVKNNNRYTINTWILEKWD